MSLSKIPHVAYNIRPITPRIYIVRGNYQTCMYTVNSFVPTILLEIRVHYPFLMSLK